MLKVVPVTIETKGMLNIASNLTHFKLNFSTLQGNYSGIGDALVKLKAGASVPPSVSSSELTKRFLVKVKDKKEQEIPLAIFFQPGLHTLEGTALDNLVLELHKDLQTLFTVTTIHHEGLASSPATNHFVSNSTVCMFTFTYSLTKF